MGRTFLVLGDDFSTVNLPFWKKEVIFKKSLFLIPPYAGVDDGPKLEYQSFSLLKKSELHHGHDVVSCLENNSLLIRVDDENLCCLRPVSYKFLVDDDDGNIRNDFLLFHLLFFFCHPAEKLRKSKKAKNQNHHISILWNYSAERETN